MGLGDLDVDHVLCGGIGTDTGALRHRRTQHFSHRANISIISKAEDVSVAFEASSADVVD
jgi:hypothetical protein